MPRRLSKMTRRSAHVGLLTVLLALGAGTGAASADTTVALFKDINPFFSPDFEGSVPLRLTEAAGTLFFVADDGRKKSGRELWKSDGTQDGTVLVRDILPGAGTSGPDQLTDVGGTLFFVANDGSTGEELWKSDGTPAGTVRVKDIVPGSGSARPEGLTAVGRTVFFSADDGTTGRELWKSDGTPVGTVRVKDIVPGSGSSHPGSLTGVGPTVFFVANDGTTGRELWKSDGTPEGTVLVRDIRPGSSCPSFFLTCGPLSLTDFAGTLFFSADDGTTGVELWKSDGTREGTVLVKDINPVGSSAPHFLTDVAGTLFFAANDSSTQGQLWKSDGTSAGTVLVSDVRVESDGSEHLTAVGRTVFFSANDEATGRELWKSDGTLVGTVLVKDIYPGLSQQETSIPFAGNSRPYGLTAVGSTVFFSANDGTTGRELWKTDGTPEGTVQVKDINPNADYRFTFSPTRFPFSLTAVGGTLFFTTDDGGYASTGVELWKSDGMPEGTVLVKDIDPGPGQGSYPRFLTPVGRTLFFAAADGAAGEELWKTDGSPQGTVLVKDIRPDAGSHPYWLTFAGETLFFAAGSDDTTGVELWKSDGTPAGTVQVRDINPEPGGGSYPTFLTVMGGGLFFAADDGRTGFELWKSDGTQDGTVLVRDIDPGSGSSWPGAGSPGGDLIVVGDALFFSADDGTTGRELWKSDGTPQGTERVRDIWPGSGASDPGFPLAVGQNLFFGADDGTSGSELWRTDGTPEGTVLVKDINPVSGAGSYPAFLTDIGGGFFFAANDGTTGRELWKSDGTAQGTRLVRDIRPGAGSSNPGSAFVDGLTAVGQTLFFAADDGTTGDELWKSDGTSDGTVLVRDIHRFGTSYPHFLTDVGGTLFFAANDGPSGQELWKSDGTRDGTVPVGGDINVYDIGGPEELTPFAGTLFLTADDGVVGSELWKVIDVAIDIKPGAPNTIRLSPGRGSIAVAILTASSFDATTVDPATVCFGDAEAPSERDCTEAHGTGHIQDVDADGNQDLVLHYETAQTGIDSRDTQACLTGQTFDGISITDCDEITVVG